MPKGGGLGLSGEVRAGRNGARHKRYRIAHRLMTEGRCLGALFYPELPKVFRMVYIYPLCVSVDDSLTRERKKQ